MTRTNDELIHASEATQRGMPAWVLEAAIALFSAVIFTIASYQVGLHHYGDFPAHLRWARELAEKGVISLTHFTYQQLVVIVRALLPFSWVDLIKTGLSSIIAAYSYNIAGLLVVAMFYALTAIILHRRFRSTFQSIGSKFSGVLALLCTLIVMLVAPINLFTLGEHRLYLGYIGINIFHNPTVIMLKPMALALFWLLLDRIPRGGQLSMIIGLAVLTVYSTFTKPNYTLALLPIIILWVIYRWWKKQPLQISIPFIGFILPAILSLEFQYILNFLEPVPSHIIFAPLVAMKYYAPSDLGWLFLLSFLFPLVVLIMQFRRAIRDQGLLLAWGVFLVGAGMTYLLAEEGPRLYHLNFEWGAQVGLFILFAQTLIFLIKNWNNKETDVSTSIPTWQKFPIVIVLMLHLASGIIWYLAEIFQWVEMSG